MRRDVFRVGLSRLAFELALGAALLLAADDRERAVGAALALAAAFVVFATRERFSTRRRTFVAAHLALGAAATGASIHRWAPFATIPLLALALGAAVELTHVDLVLRRKIHESARALRWPRSVILRRLGSVLVATAGARAMHALDVHARLASPHAVVLLVVALGAGAGLTAGFAAGPGRPHARPLDAILFVAFGAVLAVFPIR